MFRWLLESSLANRLLVLVLGTVLMGYGAFTLTRTPVDVFPDLNRPTVTVITEAGGMATEEVEQLITFPLETALNGLPGVDSVRSVSSAGLSFIYLGFDWSTEIYRARQVVAERIDALLSFDGSADIAALTLPTLVLGARDDMIVPAFLQEDLAAALPGARKILLDSGGHFFPVSRPDAFTAQVAEWIGELG